MSEGTRLSCPQRRHRDKPRRLRTAGKVPTPTRIRPTAGKVSPTRPSLLLEEIPLSPAPSSLRCSRCLQRSGGKAPRCLRTASAAARTRGRLRRAARPGPPALRRRPRPPRRPCAPAASASPCSPCWRTWRSTCAERRAAQARQALCMVGATLARTLRRVATGWCRLGPRAPPWSAPCAAQPVGCLHIASGRASQKD